MYIDHICNLINRPVHTAGFRELVLRWLLNDKKHAGSYTLRSIYAAPGTRVKVDVNAKYFELYIVQGRGVLQREEGDTIVEAGSVLFAGKHELESLVNTGDNTLEAICYV